MEKVACRNSQPGQDTWDLNEGVGFGSDSFVRHLVEVCIDVTMSMLSWQDSGRDLYHGVKLCHGVKHSAKSHCGRLCRRI